MPLTHEFDTRGIKFKKMRESKSDIPIKERSGQAFRLNVF